MNNSLSVDAVLVDARSFGALVPEIIAAIHSSNMIGLDIETHDAGRHEGLNALMAKNKRKVVFDVNRTTLCGLSLWPKGHSRAYYFNIGHADAENRLPWRAVQTVLDAKPEVARWIVHNANFERTMLEKSVGWVMKNYVCTLQMAVSAYGPDEYDIGTFLERDLGGMKNLLGEIAKVSRTMDERSEEYQEVLSKIVAKESDAAHSWNGYVADMAYGYGLKQAVRSFFGYEMQTYEQTLRGKRHMGELTGEEVASYGADDAIWCVRLYDALLAFMLRTNPDVVSTFFRQELPMVEVFSEVWREGVRIDAASVERKERENRIKYADTTRKLKGLIRALLPFNTHPHPGLLQHEKWYADKEKWRGYRDRLAAWANIPDSPDDFTQAQQLSGSIPKTWAEERGVVAHDGVNLTHYILLRTLIYDLFNEPVIIDGGKVQSDAYTRGKIKERLERKGETTKAQVVEALTTIAGLEQTSKLYLAPYRKLIDPETERMYPVISSMLATRRMSMSQPSPQQLAKRGESVYVRSFYQPDYDDHVIVSLDWSQVELCMAAELSSDEAMCSVYRQLPYEDLHSIAAAGLFRVPTEDFRALKLGDVRDERFLLASDGTKMEPKAAYKYWRTAGKNFSFELLFSNTAKNAADRMGWGEEKMMEAVNAHRDRFPGFWQWKGDIANFVSEWGYVQLFDGHRRVRYEATGAFAGAMGMKWRMFNSQEVNWFGQQVVRRLAGRARNQSVNALIQGGCAALAKRAMLRIREELAKRSWGHRQVRFMFPVHDELVFSVQRSLVTEFIALARHEMKAVGNDFRNVVLNCSVSVGLNFAPWHPSKERLGQIELDEMPGEIEQFKEYEGGILPEEHYPAVVDWLFEERARTNA